LERDKKVVTEEMKAFLQEGLLNYAPACVALSEFRRQVKVRLQSVLDDFSTQFEELGLTTADLKLETAKLDSTDLAEESSYIQLKKAHGGGIYSAYFVEWNITNEINQQLFVGTWIYLPKTRADRDHFFGELTKLHKSRSGTELSQTSDQSSMLTAYVAMDHFHQFEEPFRALIEEWTGLLSASELVKSLIPRSVVESVVDD